MGQHLGFLKNSSMLRNHLDQRGISPEECSYRLVAYGPILGEAEGMDAHKERRDLIGAMEKKLAEDLLSVGYEVMNTVKCLKPLNGERYAEVRAAFAAEFPGL